MANTELTLICSLYGELPQEAFVVTISSGATVYALKNKIYEERKHTIGPMDPAKLRLWQCSVAIDSDSFQSDMAALNLSNSQQLMPHRLLSNVFETPPPIAHAHIVVRSAIGMAETFVKPSNALKADVIEAVSITVQTFGKFTKEDICLNNITEYGVSSTGLPKTLSQLRETLRAKRPVNYISLADHQPEGLEPMARQLVETYNDYFEECGDWRLSRTTSMTISELLAYSRLTQEAQWAKNPQPMVNKLKTRLSASMAMHFVYSLAVAPLLEIESSDNKCKFDMGKSWGFPLLVHEQGHTTQRKFYPKNDFWLAPDKGWPRVLGEVVSNKQELDRFRMQLQCAVAARTANLFKQQKGSVVMAIYLTKDYQAERYLMYAEGQRVHSVMETFDVSNVEQAVDFLRQLYNYLPSIKEYGAADLDNDNPLKALITAVSDLTSLTTKVGGSRLAKRPRSLDPTLEESHQHTTMDAMDAAMNGEDIIWGSDIYDDPDILDALAMKGLNVSLVSDTHPNVAAAKWATGSRDLPVILKFVSFKDLDELLILRQLGEIPSPSNHTISVIGELTVEGGKIIIMPSYGLRLDWMFNVQHEEAVSLIGQLIEGVTFLHETGVAHRDLKPGNILIDRATGRLVIIDFSLSTRFDGLDDWVEGYNGTPGWTAPEVGKYGGLSRRYRATLADRWACGKLILFLVERSQDSAMLGAQCQLARALMNEDPNMRPALVGAQHVAEMAPVSTIQAFHESHVPPIPLVA